MTGYLHTDMTYLPYLSLKLLTSVHVASFFPKYCTQFLFLASRYTLACVVPVLEIGTYVFFPNWT